MSKTALIILTYNNSQDTRNCIESILRHNTAAVKFIVVDNASRREEFDKLLGHMSELFEGEFYYYPYGSHVRSPLPYVSLIEAGGNIGYGRGNNIGLEAAYADPEIEHVMVLNNDILFVEDIISHLITELTDAERGAIISPLLYKPGMEEYDYNCARLDVKVRDLIKDNLMHYIHRISGKDYTDIQRSRLLLKNTDKRTGLLPIELPSGSCMLAHKDLLRRIGSFDPKTFMYYEENILFKKISKLNLQNYLSLDCHCVHLGAATTIRIPNNHKLVRHAKESEAYYVQAYSGASAMAKMMHRLSVQFFLLSFALQKAVKRWTHRGKRK